MFPTITPTTISMSATEMPSRIEIKLASSASPIQNAAMNQMFSIIHRRLNLRLLQVRVCAVINHPHFLQCNQPALQHLIQHRQKGLNLLLGIDDLDHQRKIDRSEE